MLIRSREAELPSGAIQCCTITSARCRRIIRSDRDCGIESRRSETEDVVNVVPLLFLLGYFARGHLGRDSFLLLDRLRRMISNGGGWL